MKRPPPKPWVIWLLGIEALLFGAASLVHAGASSVDYGYMGTAMAEALVSAILILSIVASILRFWPPRTVALTAQGAVLGVVTIAISIGPQTRPDHIFHAILLVVLALGWIVTFKWNASSRFRYSPLP